jgi:hypothetical protein
MNVSLTPELEAFVRREVAEGLKREGEQAGSYVPADTVPPSPPSQREPSRGCWPIKRRSATCCSST